ncbi:MAG: hypothetical protein Q9160_000987 [Pyrenula sp. 1 TL-2023]
MKALTPFTALAVVHIYSFFATAAPSSTTVLQRDIHSLLPRDHNVATSESSSPVWRREPIGVAQIFGDLLPRAPAAGGCAKCTRTFCTNSQTQYRDQTDCNCKNCKNNKNKPDPQTNDRCIPDCKGNQAATGPKDASGDATCKDCPQGQKPDADHSDCVKGDCPDGQVPDGTATNSDGSKKCKKCPDGQKPDPAGEKCVKNDCPTGQVPDGTATNPDGSKKCKKCPDKQKPDPTGEKCVNDDDDKKCPPGQKPKVGGADGDCENDDKTKKREMDKELPRERDAFDKRKADNDKKKQDDEDKRKRSRIGKCLPLGALALPTLDFGFATAFFLPEFMEQLNIADYWPSDIPTCPMDVPIETDPDGYNKQWMDMARYQTYIEMTGACMANPYSCPTKRDGEIFERWNMGLEGFVAEKVKREPVNHITIPYGQELSKKDKRQVQIMGVVDIILAFLGRATSALRLLGSAALRALGDVAEKGVSLAARGARNFALKEVRDDMINAAKQITGKMNKYWKDCIKGGNLPKSAAGH